MRLKILHNQNHRFILEHLSRCLTEYLIGDVYELLPKICNRLEINIHHGPSVKIRKKFEHFKIRRFHGKAHILVVFFSF